MTDQNKSVLTQLRDAIAKAVCWRDRIRAEVAYAIAVVALEREAAGR